MQRAVGNRGMGALLARFSTGQTTAPAQMTAAEVAKAIHDNHALFNRKSIRTIQALLGYPSTGWLQEKEVVAIQAMRRTTSSPARGVVDEFVLDQLIRKAVKTPDMYAHVFYLVEDFLDAWLERDILTVRFDPGLKTHAVRTGEGRLGVVTLGPMALADGLKGMRAAVEGLGSPRFTPSQKAPSVLSADLAAEAARRNQETFTDLRSPAAIKDASGAKTNDGLGTETAQWVAAFQKRTSGLTATGIVDDETLRAIVQRLVSAKLHKSAIRLLVDRWALDDGGALDVDYEPQLSAPFDLDRRTGDAPTRIVFGEGLFRQTYVGTVRTLADAFAQASAHAARLSPEQQEFHGKSTRLTQDLPTRSLAAFEQDIRDVLAAYSNMTDKERLAAVWRLMDVRKRVIERYIAEGKTKQPLEDELAAAIDAERPQDALMRP